MAVGGVICGGLIAVLAAILGRLDLDTAAAWANILALFVGVLGFAVGLLAVLPRPTHERQPESVQGRSAPPSAGRSETASGRDQYNIGSVGTFNVHNGDDR
jgi:hypothetical protein